MLIDAAYAELAVRTLHSLYGLDKQTEPRVQRLRAASAADTSLQARGAACAVWIRTGAGIERRFHVHATADQG